MNKVIQDNAHPVELLKFDQVSKFYRQGGLWSGSSGVRALDHVSLSLYAGQCLMLVGASGSGKSTLGRLLLGLECPDTGEIYYKGTAWRMLKDLALREARRNIQVVFQNSYAAVDPRFTARDIIAEPLRNYTSLKGDFLTERVAELLEKVGLQRDALIKYPHQFSGGELQRVCIARALALEPEVIVLDEAVSSLDVIHQGHVLTLLAQIKEETKTAFLFITHDLRIVSKLADALAILDKGRLDYYEPNIDEPGAMERMKSNLAFQNLAQAMFAPLPRQMDF